MNRQQFKKAAVMQSLWVGVFFALMTLIASLPSPNPISVVFAFIGGAAVYAMAMGLYMFAKL